MFIELIKKLLNKDIISKEDLRALTETKDLTEEFVKWYKDLGFETLFQRQMTLTKCPFTNEEIEIAKNNQEFIIAIPKNITAKQFSELFRIESVHNLDDKLIQFTKETEDTWVKVSSKDIPDLLNHSFTQIRNKFEEENKVGMNLPRYLVFVAWFYKKNNTYPDMNYWNYLIGSKYDKSGVMIAGFDDKNKKLNLHGWKKNHPNETWLGARYAKHPSRIEVRKETI